MDLMFNDMVIEIEEPKKNNASNRLKAYAEFLNAAYEDKKEGKSSLMAKEEKTAEKEVVLLDRLQEKNWVQKSDPLMILSQIPFSLGELKVLDTYISRINMKDEDKRLVKFTKKEYEKLMGAQELNRTTLRKYLNDLQDKKIRMDVGGQFIDVNLFQLSGFVKDHGESCILLECTDRAKPLFFNLKHYTKYELKYILSLTSQYSYTFYLYIKKNCFRGSWNESVDVLRDEVFGLEGIETYSKFKYFHDKIIKRAVEEVNELTDCYIDYEMVKKGRYVTEIKFSYKKNPRIESEDIEGQMTISDFIDENSDKKAEEIEKFEREMLEKYGERFLGYARATEYRFEPEEIEYMHIIIAKIDPPADRLTGDKWFGYYNYLEQMYKKMMLAEKQGRKPIKKKYQYLVKMLESEVEE